MSLRFQNSRKPMRDEMFLALCRRYPDCRIEMTKNGEFSILPPATTKTGALNFLLIGRLAQWFEGSSHGIGFDSSTVFSLPNGAKRSPDLAWIRRERWNALTPDEQNDFAPICPDFVVELRSKTDHLKSLQKKMDEYIANGARLGWLIDPIKHQVHIYRPEQAVEILDQPKTLSGEQVLHGFVLDLTDIITE